MTFSTLLKTTAITLVAIGFTASAHAQFGGLKDKLKKKAADEVVEAVTQSGDTSAEAEPAVAASAPVQAGTTSLGKPAANLVSMINCTALKPTNIMVGNLGDYTFQDGFSTEERSGFVNRKPGSLSNGCILPSINSRDVIYMEVETAAYEAMGSSNDWSMQCIKSADPSAGAVGQDEPKTEYPYKVNFLAGKDMMLHCGNSESVDVCAEGSNSSRSGAWDKDLKARGMTMLSVHGNTSTLAPAGGEKLFCQYYNSKTRKSLFAFEYLRKRN